MEKLFSESAIVSWSERFSKKGNVYFLVKDGKVIYVGSTDNLVGRLYAHQKRFNMDSYHSIECEIEDMIDLEYLYYKKLSPVFNKIPPCSERYKPLRSTKRPKYMDVRHILMGVELFNIKPVVYCSEQGYIYDAKEIEKEFINHFGHYKALSKEESDELKRSHKKMCGLLAVRS